MPSDNNLLTPIYQDALIVSLNAIIPRLTNQDFKGAWVAMQTFYYDLPPKVVEDVKSNFQKIVTDLEDIPNHLTGDFYFQGNEIKEKEEVYLRKEIWLLHEKIKNSMVDHGYYLFESNRPPTRESSMKDLEYVLTKAKYSKE